MIVYPSIRVFIRQIQSNIIATLCWNKWLSRVFWCLVYYVIEYLSRSSSKKSSVKRSDSVSSLRYGGQMVLLLWLLYFYVPTGLIEMHSPIQESIPYCLLLILIRSLSRSRPFTHGSIQRAFHLSSVVFEQSICHHLCSSREKSHPPSLHINLIHG